MKIAIGSDHAGFFRKNEITTYLMKEGHEVVDIGCFSEESCDYPDYAKKVARSVALGNSDRGVLICGTGIGMAMAANKFKGVRAAVCWNPKVAALASEHNQANVLCLSGRFLSLKLGVKIVSAWLKTPFAGGRHLGRVRKIGQMQAAKILGRVVCSRKVESLEGTKLLLIQPLEWDGRDKGFPIVATDTVGAGAGELVFWVAGKEAAIAHGGNSLEDTPPADAAIVGIVEGVNLQEWTRKIQMIVARVVGNVWGTKKHPALQSSKLLLVQPIEMSSKEVKGTVSLAVDPMYDAGPGDTVLLVDEGNSARGILKNKSAPVRLAVCGVVDEVNFYGKLVKYH